MNEAFSHVVSHCHGTCKLEIKNFTVTLFPTTSSFHGYLDFVCNMLQSYVSGIEARRDLLVNPSKQAA